MQNIKLSQQTDVIRQNNKDYLRANSQNSFIKQRVGSIAGNIYSFPVLFGATADKDTCDEMKDTYWIPAGHSDECEYDDEIEIVRY